MAILRIRVEWLDGRYHGVEWPPSPWRLFQAMVAGLGDGAPALPEREAALRHLETLGAPVVTAPRAALLAPVTARVPSNDADLVLALHAKGEPVAAREKQARLASLRTRRARGFEGEVTYDFEAAPETPAHLPALGALAGSVSAVGHGIDLALARAALLERPRPAPGVRHAPSPDGTVRLAVPWPGGLDALDERHRNERTRIGAREVRPGFETAPRTVAYRAGPARPAVRWAAFELRSPDLERRLAVEGTRAMEVAAMVRHEIGRAARHAGLDGRLVSELMGHRGEGRIRAQPLPSVGHRHADGRIRRVLLTAPRRVNEDAWREVVSRLPGAALLEPGGGPAAGLLVPLAEPDGALARYLGQGRSWTSATPVVLPGHDSRRGRPRPRRALKRLLRHAGICETLLESAAFEPRPRARGSAHPLAYRRPAHLARYPAVHLSIRWQAPLQGPLAFGAGVGYGLGLLVPVDEPLPGHRRGDVEGS